MPGDKLVFDLFYLARLVLFFHLMLFVRYLFCSLTLRNMSSSFSSLLLKLNRKSNYRDLALSICFFITALLSIFFNQFVSITWSYLVLGLREILPRLRFLPKAFLANIKFMNSDDPVTFRDTYPSILELLSILVALMVFGVIDAYQKQSDQIQKQKDQMVGKKPKKESWKNKFIKSK